MTPNGKDFFLVKLIIKSNTLIVTVAVTIVKGFCTIYKMIRILVNKTAHIKC